MSNVHFSVGSRQSTNPVHGFGVWAFWRVCISVLVDEPVFERVRSSVFPDVGLGSTHFWPIRFILLGFEWVRSLVLVDEPVFESSTCQV